MAQFMYDTGWDVLAFAHDAEQEGDDLPTTEIINARQRRFVERHAVIGYSWGGGATHDLIRDLSTNHGISTNVGVFLDAVIHGLAFAENRWPGGALYLLNIYQLNPGLNGGSINQPDGELEEINTTTDAGWDHGLGHLSIDDDFLVGNLIVTRLQEELQNR